MLVRDLHLLHFIEVFPALDTLTYLSLKITFKQDSSSLLLNRLEEFQELPVTDAGLLDDLDELVPGEDGDNARMKLLVFFTSKEVNTEVRGL